MSSHCIIPNNKVLCNLQDKIQHYLKIGAKQSALFWADKVVSLGKGNPRDIYWLAQCLFQTQQYHRAVLLITRNNLDKTQPLCKLLAGLALYEAKEYEQVLLTLTNSESSHGSQKNVLSLNHTSSFTMSSHYFLEGFTVESLQSAILLLRGKVYVKLNDNVKAVECFKEAIKKDIFNFEVLKNLIQYKMLSAKEEEELLSSLKDQYANQNFPLVLYELLLSKCPSVPSSLVNLIKDIGLAENIDLQVVKAERLYYACEYSQCLSLTEEVLKVDSYHSSCLPVHISCMFELKKVNSLFYLAHNLVDTIPQESISWFAVGCYYLLIANFDLARKYLAKSASLDKLFGSAWIAYGHSFALENEHDQAMAAYFSASKIMKGSHLPLLYLGTQCGLTNNLLLAEKFLSQAQIIAPEDPFVNHELGINAFQNHDFVTAEKHFLTALCLVQKIRRSGIAEQWEPLYNNLGHVCRKLKKYEDAVKYHQEALVLCPQNPSTLACIGLTMTLKGDFTEAIIIFHKVLGLQRDDIFSKTMLSLLIEHSMESELPL